MTRTPRIVIVGAGFAGVGLAALLTRDGIDTYQMYEKADGVGGAWWHNRYPGAEVDSSSCGYSFPFKPYPWSRSHARRAEVQSYLEDTVAEYGIAPHLHLGVGVERAVWDDENHTYAVELDNGDVVTADVLVAATGFLNIPRYPTWPGLESFTGRAFHTARWESHCPLEDKTVAIVGTGSTATQLVPELAKTVRKLYVFQREPGWIVPKGERDHTPKQQARLANPLWFRWERFKLFKMIEKVQWRARLYIEGTQINDTARKNALAFIERELGDRPDLQKAVTPDYPYWGKRLILNSTYYAALKNDNVELIPRAVVSVTENALRDTDGVEHPIDVLIMATGFQPTNYLGTLEIRGRDGRTLRECWDGAPRAFAGITVPNFPNLFMMYGPGTNGGEIVSMLMQQGRYIVRCIKRMTRTGATSLEVKQLWADSYDLWLQSKVNATVWATNHNYYKAESGRVVTQWPFSPLTYATLVRALGRASLRVSSNNRR